MLNYHPIPIVAWEFVEPGTYILGKPAEPQQFIFATFANGSTLLLKRHPTATSLCGHARLYAAGGDSLSFFSLSYKGLKEIKPCWNKAMTNYKGGSHYPILQNYRDEKRKIGLLCHHAMFEIWHGERLEGCQLHHLNRDKFDWCERNLIQLSVPEHRNANARQKLIESVVHDLHVLSHNELRELTLMPGSEFLKEIQELRQLFSC